MKQVFTTGYTYTSPKHSMGFEAGKFYVEPFTTIARADQEATLSPIYDRTLEQIQRDILEGRERYPRIIPVEGKNEAAFAYLKVLNLAGRLVNSPIALAVGSHEKIGRLGKRSQVANVDSVVVRALGDDASCLEGKSRILRGNGAAKAVTHVLLHQFDPDIHVTVMGVPETLRPEEKEAVEQVLVGGYGFARRTSGKTSRGNDGNGQVWYEGPTVQEVQDQLASGSDMIMSGQERTVKLAESINIAPTAIVGGIASSNPLHPYR